MSRRSTMKKLQPEQGPEILALYAQGFTTREVSIRLNVRLRDVRDHIKSHGHMRGNQRLLVTCRGCGQSFFRGNHANRILACKTCCPTPKDQHRFREYGITRATFDELWARQAGTCALCPAELSDERPYGLNVDHCHTTGVVRGLLCVNCNRLLGQLEARPDWFDRARTYVSAVRSTQT